MRNRAQVAPQQYSQPGEVSQQEDALQRVPIYPGAPEGAYNKLERDFYVYTYGDAGSEQTLGYGDKMRIMDNQGNLKDIMLMPDGNIGIQDLELKLEYGKTETYPTWDDAASALPSMEYEPVGHTASLRTAARKLKLISKNVALGLYKLFRSALENDDGNGNPYASRRWKRSRKPGNG